MHSYPTLALALLLASPAAAQIAPSSPSRQRAANRQALREARRTPAPYKESHLAVTRQQLRRGGSETLVPAAGEPRFDHDGTPHVTEPSYPALRRRKPKAKPTPTP